MLKKVFLYSIIGCLMLSFSILSCSKQDFGEMVTIPKIAVPKDEQKLCNIFPVLEWTPVQYADKYIIKINGEKFDEVLSTGKLDENVTYDMNDSKNVENFIALYKSETIVNPPFSIEPYELQIVAAHEFQYMPSEKVNFYYMDCKDPTIIINTPGENSSVTGTITVSGVTEDPESGISKIEIQLDNGEKVEVPLRDSYYNKDTGEFEFTLDAETYPGTGGSDGTTTGNNLNLPPGEHVITVIVYDGFGNAYEKKVKISVVPECPTPRGPKDNICMLAPTFEWEKSDYVEFYQLQVSTSASFDPAND